MHQRTIQTIHCNPHKAIVNFRLLIHTDASQNRTSNLNNDEISHSSIMIMNTPYMFDTECAIVNDSEYPLNTSSYVWDYF